MCKEVDDLLEVNGVDVKYVIYLVVGCMFGYMNVLLVEVDVFYFKLLDLDDVNDVIFNIDIVVIVGVNDVVNLLVLDDFGSLIYGMLVLNVWEVKYVIVLKCSMSFGYVGI